MKQKEVIAELKEMLINQIERVHVFQELEAQKLSTSKNPSSWNALQCLEHLNRYAHFYVNSIGAELQKRKPSSADPMQKEFKPGYFGKKFCESMLPAEDGSIKKMKTFKSKDPGEQESNMQSLENFLDYQDGWLKLLERVKEYDLNRNKCKLTIPLIKMNLGSTLRFVIYHQERHILQAEKAVGITSNTSSTSNT